ncbi:MAG: hypothetical protein ACREPR_15815, partial [Brasilonema sp.]
MNCLLPMSRHHPPAYLRYLKARLWNLTRPSIWGTAIFLSVVGLVIKEYWTHPDFFTHWQRNQVAEKPANSSLSEEDRAITADIDDLPVPYNTDPNQANPPAVKSLAPRQNTQAKNSKSLLDALNSKGQTSTSDSKLKVTMKEGDSTPVIKLENPFLTQAENLLQLKNFQSGSNSQGVNALTASLAQQNSAQNSFGLGTALANQTSSNQNNVSENALQTALHQLNNQNQRTGFNRDTTNSLNVGTGSTQSGAISPTSYIQPGVTTQLQNLTPGTSYPQPGINSLQPQNPVSPTSYIQPGVTTQLQNLTPGTSYPQTGINNLQPQNPISGTTYIQQGISNQPQNSFPRTAYPQSQSGLTGIPQTPSAVPNRSATIFNEMMRNRLNNINSGQQLPNVTQPTSVVSPSSNTLTTNQGSVIYNTPLTSTNSGNSVLQPAPAPVPQYIYSYPTQ